MVVDVLSLVHSVFALNLCFLGSLAVLNSKVNEFSPGPILSNFCVNPRAMWTPGSTKVQSSL